MAVLYTLDRYVNDLRAITAGENDPVKKKSPIWSHHWPRNSLNRRDGFAPNIVNATPSKGSAFTCFTKSPTTI
jgi:hypothetical protein